MGLPSSPCLLTTEEAARGLLLWLKAGQEATLRETDIIYLFQKKNHSCWTGTIRCSWQWLATANLSAHYSCQVEAVFNTTGICVPKCGFWKISPVCIVVSPKSHLVSPSTIWCLGEPEAEPSDSAHHPSDKLN